MSDDDATVPDDDQVDDDDDDELDAEVDPEQLLAIEAAVECEVQKRHWLKAALPYASLELPAEGDVPPAVRTAAARCRTAALDRVARILRSDVVEVVNG